MVKRGWLILGVVCWVAVANGQPALYKIEPGPYAVRNIDKMTLLDAVQDRDITLRILYPEAAGPFPLVVFSTGAFCYPQMYDRITGHWVSHGYVVVEPNHLDSPNNAGPPTPDQYPDFMPSRIRDVSFVLDAIEDLNEHPDILDRIGDDRFAIAGHSFGAVISMIKTGLHIKEEYRGSWGDIYDERFQAAVLLSAPGPEMKEMAANAFDGLRRPLIATGGTNDVGRVDLGDRTPAEWRRQAFMLAPPGDKYSVITAGSDHYLGGLICNAERGGEPDYEAVAIVRAMTTAFLDAYIKNDADALSFLKTADISDLTDDQASYRVR
jgi:pimeloyl-ACP methyl ester carboxylesterase